jgi:hypothetical protein
MLPVVALMFAWVSIVPWAVRLPALTTDTPPAVAKLLSQAQARLNAGKAVSSIVSLDVTGTRTRSLDTKPTVDPYEFKLLLPDRFQWRSGDVLHTFAGGVFWQNIRVDEAIRKTAARSLQHNLMKVCLTYLAGVSPAMTTTAEDQGVRDFQWVKGRTISVYNPVEHLRIEFVLDEETAQPLATVTHGRIHNADGSSVENDTVAIFQDYRDVAGVRFPHRIEERSKTDHALVALTKVVVNTLGAADFVDKAPPARQ